ncbi:ABC transporter ATP-binding protein [Caldicellulosiruptor morganii]|uniref:ATP-binding cassette domain-containing protein n=1 Tax=Caldicellulosiruptor morganii TaxID=1387555 RepID=A0ABY7BP52_9FIRM|nr:ATP-binding cassette domain-containing protein [Caldicellulosiruptor morganii]WAM34349.1 ATP-binding cassette domain-containing protein [Caldicellulosiruptor morganii]
MIQLINVFKRYGEKTILDNVCYTFEKGSVYIINGKNGSGKSTLLNIIAGYIKPDSGTIIIDDEQSIGYVYQEDLLLTNLTVEENFYLKYLASKNINLNWYKCQKEEIFRILNLQKLKDKKVSFLSGGEKKRLQFAQLLLSQPHVFLLDEIFSALDEESENAVIRILEKISKDKIIIIVSHKELNFKIETISLKLEEGRLILNDKRSL